ncbi:TetR/AcrR family transcriptional regulator [Paenibacillus jilunlii]|uniref:TetR family transcriptional regulator n=1 Tax=Paenibacillus jilunlii TaxID=682956 RepID=A0A1G9UD41_9BACL|nr:TetR/AcrR family transcriptional regulator [Paenibacillus jilunlii]KWX77878.1 TetR family transcriptional regulator [Paenibacillus jilunlii]SDM57828.1 transcriptional regulator, TetR family [Paenibacillus jilunlii]
MSKSSSFLSKTEIMDAAEQTLRRFGPDKTSVTDVAKLLGVSHGTLYRHFPSKAALREAVTERWLEEQIVAPLEQIVKAPADNALAQLKVYIARLIELKLHYAEQDSEMFKMYTDVTMEAAELIEVHIQRIMEQMGILIDRGIQQKRIAQSAATSSLARSLFHATSRFHHPAHAHEWRSASIEQEFEQVWQLLEQGLTASIH